MNRGIGTAPRDDEGDLIREQDVELPPNDRNRTADPAYRLVVDRQTGEALHVGAGLRAWSAAVKAEEQRRRRLDGAA